MKKILILLLTLNSCIGPIDVEYEKYESVQEMPLQTYESINAQEKKESESEKNDNSSKSQSEQISTPIQKKVDCSIPFNKHTACTKCPLGPNVDPKPEDVRRYLRFGTGRGHTIYTPSHDHGGRYVLLLTDTFGQAQRVWQCGNKGCNEMELSWSFSDKKRIEFGFANDCRQHWRYVGSIDNLHSITGKRNLYFKVRKNNKDYTFSVPRGKTFKDRME